MQRVSPDPSARRVISVGLGRAGALATAALRRRDDVRIVAAVDPDPAAALDGVPVLRSLEELPDAEIAIVSTPTPGHPEVCEALFEQVTGLSLVLCEKPAALSAERLTALVATARGRGIELRVLLHYAFGSEVAWLAGQLGDLGPVASFSATFEDPYGDALAERTRTLVSSWADSGINALTVASRLVDLKTVVDSHAAGADDSRTEIAFQSVGTVGTGTIATSWRVREPRKQTSLTLADGATVDVDHTARRVTIDGRVAYDAPTDDAPLRRYEAMIDAHLDDAPTLFDQAATLHLHRLVEDGLAAQLARSGT